MSNINSQGVDANTGQQRAVSPADTFLVNGHISCPGSADLSEKFGFGASASGVEATALGWFANASMSSSTAIGAQAVASINPQATAIGSQTNAAGSGSVALGFDTTASGTLSIGIGGAGVLVQADNAIAIGLCFIAATHTASIAFNGVTTAANQFVAGGSSFISDVYFGRGVDSSGPIAYTIHGTGGSGIGVAGANLNLAGGISGDASTPGGNVVIQTARTGSATSPTDAVIVAGSDGSISCPGAGLQSERFGSGTSAAGAGNVAVGFNASASGTSSIAIGRSASATLTGLAIGDGASATNLSVMIGGGVSSGVNTTVCVGTSSSATGNQSTVIGYSAAGSGFCATAYGQGASAGTRSIAIGVQTTTTTTNQFVCGTGVLVSGLSVAINDVYFGKGVHDATPTTYTIHGTGGFGATIAGADLALAGGIAGDAATAGGSVRLKTAKTGSGTTLTDAVIVDGGTGFTAIGTSAPTSHLEVQGSVGFKLLSVAGAFTLDDAEAYLVDTTAGSGTGTLPDATTCSGRQYDIKKNGAANSVTINPVLAQTIERDPSLTWTTDLKTYTLRSDGANWWIF